MSRGSAAYDWIVTYYPTSTAFLVGQTRLYDDPALATEFYYPPWSLLLFLGPALLGSAPGLAVFRMATLAALAWVAVQSCPRVRLRVLVVALAVASLYTVDVIALGQTSAFVALGIWLAWRSTERRRPLGLVLGFALMMTKPHLIALPAMVLLAALRGWPAALRLHAAGWFGALVLLSVGMSGGDWPLRWVAYVRTSMPPPSDAIVSIYRMGELFSPALFAAVAVAAVTVAWIALRLLRDRPGWPLLLVATAANIALSPVVRDYDYAIAMALVWPALAAHTPVVAISAYVLHILLYVLVPGSPQLLLLHPLVAVLLLAGCAWHYASQQQQTQADHRNEPEEPVDGTAGQGVGEQGVRPLQPD